jgi:hypothetical protein
MRLISRKMRNSSATYTAMNDQANVRAKLTASSSGDAPAISDRNTDENRAISRARMKETPLGPESIGEC